LGFSSIREADVRHIAEDAAIEWSFCNAILELSQQTISVDEKVKEGQQAWAKLRFRRGVPLARDSACRRSLANQP
jgi:hypothetical protein